MILKECHREWKILKKILDSRPNFEYNGYTRYEQKSGFTSQIDSIKNVGMFDIMGLDMTNPQPLYRQIVADIKSKIASGTLSAGDQIGSHQNLSQEYGVSLITVKKALSDLISEGVLFSRVGKGTFVAQRPERVDFGTHKSIGLVLEDLRNPFFSRIVDSVEKAAYEQGYNILISNSSGRIEKEEAQIRHFRQIGVSGVIIASLKSSHRASHSIRKIHEENFPYVMVSFVQDPDICYVGSDHEHGAFLATEHLIKLGYQKIGYINAEEGNVLGELRKQGYLSALQQYDRPLQAGLVFQLRGKDEWSHYHSGYRIGKQFGELPERPDAIFAYNDVSALGFEKAILEQGVSIPDDIAIVGFDNIEQGQVAAVPLTTVHQPTDEIGSISVDLLVAKIHGQDSELRKVLESSLVIRESCGALKKGMVKKASLEPLPSWMQ